MVLKPALRSIGRWTGHVPSGSAIAAAQGQQMTIRKCYLSINQSGISANLDLLKVAIHSCYSYAGLQPILLYAGDPVPELEILERLGATIVHHQVSFEKELQIGYGDRYRKFLGHWLRVDIPLIETEDEYVLYADCDVLFRKEISVADYPTYIAVAPEFSKDNWSYFNSGVMVINVANMRAIHSEFRENIRHRLTNNFQTPPHDQKSFNDFFGDKYDRLPLEMNWKPYWGVNEAASMVHFHGLKPAVAIRAMTIENYQLTDNIRRLWEKNKAAYVDYCQLYTDVLAEANAAAEAQAQPVAAQ
ncbi:hypothetical protein DM806_07515 [Sphingobium lactosutens]|uniref:hypothetical protein n=1 Tax=Sphingobium lactosutens TaxID=522773 RepID=UPI0015C08E70|nr:hypothetical protein [Sphingobium lactosutens]NWK95518.1 hypothetical protein [Sphingobium lactosutens]